MPKVSAPHVTGPRITLTGTLNCATAQDAELVRAHLPEHVRLSRAEPGCLSFDVLPDADPLVFAVAERFADRAAFEAHQERTRASAWWAATGHIRRDFTVAEAE